MPVARRFLAPSRSDTVNARPSGSRDGSRFAESLAHGLDVNPVFSSDLLPWHPIGVVNDCREDTRQLVLRQGSCWLGLRCFTGMIAYFVVGGLISRWRIAIEDCVCGRVSPNFIKQRHHSPLRSEELDQVPTRQHLVQRGLVRRICPMIDFAYFRGVVFHSGSVCHDSGKPISVTARNERPSKDSSTSKRTFVVQVVPGEVP